ncbi:MAG: hypothetical protein GWM93_06380 [Gemmatimonadetes bacterium]|uniref:Uncharacterized protein n=1 Tax=Candidatus Kutchimonas denitrificans TaxID=3056748 RepID=A0AAE5CC15_9BACT|nr:hypothetical protein [Gemmatimonadota bacterium]NIR73664.1 hypothetical protein [Candidatus Kutchimonas denitrificans]NIT66301.1 hypothetical protein [Gemmatimonadota bacterium]NIY34878.1 hypothetical protein [Gemmatimonadota bacterium]NIY44054.1 hypothetical protein [Gemmatimonadota bacterium]
MFRVIPGADDPWPERERIISWSPYDWRIIAGSKGELIASLGVITGSAFAIRGYESLEEVLRDAKLRSCDRQHAHYISCVTRLEGEHYIATGRVVVRMRDPEFLSRFLELRPSYVRLVTMLLDTYTRSDSVPVSYQTP